MFQIVKKLRLVNRSNGIKRPYLTVLFVVPQEIDPVPNGEQLLAVVNDRHWHLCLDLKAALLKLILQAGRVSAFEQPGPKLGMNGKRSIQHPLRQLIQRLGRLHSLAAESAS